MLAKPLHFSNLTLDDPNYDEDVTTRGMPDSDTRLMQMLAAQAQHLGGEAFGDVDAIAADEKLSEKEKKTMLQKALVMSASNGDLENVKKILSGKARPFVDLNAPDEDGTPSLVYASCFVSVQLEIDTHVTTIADNIYLGSRNRGASSGRCWGGCGQTRSQLLEPLDVGNDE